MPIEVDEYCLNACSFKWQTVISDKIGLWKTNLQPQMVEDESGWADQNKLMILSRSVVYDFPNLPQPLEQHKQQPMGLYCYYPITNETAHR